MINNEKITICIPTKNRPEFLFRSLNFFADTKYKDWIFIGDASDESHLTQVKNVIKPLENKLNIKHFECPGMNVNATVDYMNQLVTTPYCLSFPDDDFLCVKGINKCIDFLDNNPDYGAAHGKAIAVSIDRIGPYGNIKRAHPYQQAILEEKSGSGRLYEYFSSLHTIIFSVHHTKDWQDMFHGFKNQTSWARQGFIFDELVPSAISSVRHKIKEMDFLYLVRFSHDQQYNQLDTRSWLRDKNWQNGFKALREITINELVHQDHIDIQKGNEVFNNAFSPYLKRIKKDNPRGQLLKMRRSLNRIPIFNTAYTQFKFHLYKKNTNKYLSSLLEPSSWCYEDFLPIYQAITKPINTKEKIDNT